MTIYDSNGGYISAIVTSNGVSKQVSHFVKNVLTNNGRDVFHQQCYTNTSAGTRGFGYIAVTTDTAAESASDTSLAQEIGGGGLGRADATTKSHSNGTNSSTVEHTFTASATYNSVYKAATFNAGSGVTMGHEAKFNQSASLIANDTLKVTWTLNLG